MISFRSLTPKPEECTNLLVCAAVSSSHIAFGSVRMEPVFMLLGHSAATAAVFSLEDNIDVQRVDYRKLRQRLLQEGQRLDVDLQTYPPRPPEAAG